MQVCLSACWKVGVNVIDCRESVKCPEGYRMKEKGTTVAGVGVVVGAE